MVRLRRTEQNVDAVRDDLALMVSGIPVPANVREYAATKAGDTETMEEILEYAHNTMVSSLKC